MKFKILAFCYLFICGCDDEQRDDTYDYDSPPDSSDHVDTVDGNSLVWISISGGSFSMGSSEMGEMPMHEVTLQDFDMTKTEITVAQYADCVDDGVCTEPISGGKLNNWGNSEFEDHPVNEVNWDQAVAFCTWVGGRLPSEAEWEYAARSEGQNITYPWGNERATCEYTVMRETNVAGCGTGRTMAVCSITAGNTDQGICDMTGNVWEWVQDWYNQDYTDAPTDGSAWEDPIREARVFRSGGFASDYPWGLRAAFRAYKDPSAHFNYLGIRCAR